MDDAGQELLSPGLWIVLGDGSTGHVRPRSHSKLSRTFRRNRAPPSIVITVPNEPSPRLHQNDVFCHWDPYATVEPDLTD